jgi:hypothetical protein
MRKDFKETARDLLAELKREVARPELDGFGRTVEPPLDVDALSDEQKRVYEALPASVQNWLALCDGVEVDERLHGLGAILETLEIFDEWKEKGWTPIGDDCCGNYYVCIPCELNGETRFPVVFLDAECDDEGYIVASDPAIFYVEQLKETLRCLAAITAGEDDFEGDSWIFDEEKRLAEDLEIAAFGIWLPWDEEDDENAFGVPIWDDFDKDDE